MVGSFKLSIPEDYVGDAMGRLNAIGATFLKLDKDSSFVVTFEIEESNLDGFAEWLDRLTNGKSELIRM